MNIIVKGFSKKEYKPNKILVNFEVENRDEDYNKCINVGIDKVLNLINKFVERGYDKTTFETLNYSIREERIQDKLSQEIKQIGFVFHQSLILKLDYNSSNITNLFESIKELEGCSRFHFSFRLDNAEQVRKDLIKDAYLDAMSKAQQIANVANTKIVKCERISYDTNNFDLISPTHFNSQELCRSFNMQKGLENNFEIIFNPQNIIVELFLDCHFIAD